MTHLDHFHFLRPTWLLLIPVVVWIWWLVRARRDPLRSWRAWMDHKLLDALTVDGGLPPSSQPVGMTTGLLKAFGRFRGTALLFAWLTAVVGISGPTWRLEPSPFADDPVPVMLVLKAGESMELADLAPSRMERARLKIADFAAEREGQPLGLIAYSGSAHLVLPPTRDTSVVAAMATEISPLVMPRAGDDPISALRLAARTLGESGGSIVVLADALPPGDDLAWRKFRDEFALPIHFLAVARPDTPQWDSFHDPVAALRASMTTLTPDATDVRSLVRRTAKAPVTVGEAAEGTRWEEAGWWLVPVSALMCLLTFRRSKDAGITHAARDATRPNNGDVAEPKETRG